MDAIVLAKEILDTRDLIDAPLDDSGVLKAESLESRFDPEDMNALEMALKLKDEHGWRVTVLSIGRPRRLDVLRESLYRGADEVVRIHDVPIDFMDSSAQARLFVEAIRKIGRYDLILTGVQTPEANNSLVGCHVAAGLGIDSLTYVDQLEGVGQGEVMVRRAIERGIEVVQSPMPVVLLVGVALLKEDPRAPRSARAKLKLLHKKRQIEAWSPSEGEPAPTVRIEGYERKVQREFVFRRIEADDLDGMKEMLAELKEKGTLR